MLRKLIFQLIILIATCVPLFADFNPFDPNFRSYMFGNFDSGDRVEKILVQSNGKIILGGQFTKYNGEDRKNIVRINADGTIDATFNPGTGANKKIYDMLLLSNGQILVAGDFTSFNGVSVKGIVRLNANGSVDQTFNVPAFTTTGPSIRKIGFLSNGKIMVSGSALIYVTNGINNWSLARLNSNGTIDTTFSAKDNFTWVESFAVQSNDKLIVCGFIENGGRKTIARVNLDGSLDNTFVGDAGDNYAQDIKIQSDGKIIISGNFSTYKSVEVNGIARLASNGNLDTGFNSGGTGIKFGNQPLGVVNSLTLQADGKIIAAGTFGNFNNTSVRCIVRLNTNGTIDPTFKAPYDVGGLNSIWATAVQADGKILIGGAFKLFENNVSIDFITRFLDCFAPNTPVNTTTKTTYCRNDLGELSVTGSGTMKWYTTRIGTTVEHEGLTFNKPIIYSSYYVESSNSCAVNPKRTEIHITLNSTPVTMALGNNNVCEGEAITLRGGSSLSNVQATSFAWSDGVVNEQSFIPTATKTYTVTGTADNGCSSTATITVTVKPLPNVTAIASNTSICNGTAVTLTGDGATTYSWSDGRLNNVSFTPTATQTYTVTGTTNGCSKTATVNVEVKPMPNTDIITTNTSLTSAQSHATYQWINCPENSILLNETNPILFSNDEDEYKVIITLNGCIDSSLCVATSPATSLFNTFNPNFSIFPNPSNGNFVIKTASRGDYLIVNEAGQIMQSFTINDKEDYSIQLDNTENGIYFLITNPENNQINSQKIIVIK